ncbi:MAG TPA: hypothetical protein VMF06_05955 [Candidatus Limnocylindria bacterium]|jgi:hypothetical protein|nr:hypothetical protein [Candidatus Limnocylindria bacterium]
MQQQFDFDTPSSADSYEAWVQERRQRLTHLARENGLPLGHPCRVNLASGIELSGVLRLAEDKIPMNPERDPELLLRIDRCTFHAKEIVSAVRVD